MNLGLRECSNEPQEYVLSEVLYSYGKGNFETLYVTQTLSVPNEKIKDGYWNVKVPFRFKDNIGIFNRIRLASKVLLGKADILHYR